MPLWELFCAANGFRQIFEPTGTNVNQAVGYALLV